MLIWLRRRLAHDDGISLVEVLVAMLILMVVLTAMANTLITSLFAITNNERQSRGTQLGNELLEQLQALPWDTVGFYTSDSPSTAEGTPVIVGATRDALEEAVTPHPDGCTYGEAVAGVPPVERESVERDGVCYDVERAIVWENHGDGDYKKFIVTVSWAVGSRPRTARVAATRAPAPGDGIPVFAAELDVDATEVTYNVDQTAATPSTLTFTATLTSPADSPVSLTWDDAGTAVPTSPAMTSSDGGLTWTTAVDMTAAPWDPGDVIFTFTATAGESEAQDQVTVTFTQEGAPPVVEVRSLTLSQPGPPTKTPICVKGGNGSNAGKPDPNLFVDIDVRGLGSVDDGRVKVSWTDQSVAQIANYETVNAAGDGAVFRLIVDNNLQFTNAEQTFEVHIDDAFAGAFGPFAVHSGSAC